jgi:predicted AAA+ superfamily ATPase
MDYVREILSSGFPGIRQATSKAQRLLLKSYIESVVDEEMPLLGLNLRRPESLVQWLRAYAAATSTTATFESIADAIPEDARPSRATIADYREALSKLWLLDSVPAFTLSRNRLKELGKMPKHHLADPALAAVVLGVTEETLVNGSAGKEFVSFRDGPLLGNLFESLATLCVRVYAQPLDLEVSHIRTARGEHEIDLIAHGPDGRSLAFEMKLASVPSDRDTKHLNWLGEKMGNDLVDRVILTTGKQAYRRPDGIAVVPLALLGP